MRVSHVVPNASIAAVRLDTCPLPLTVQDTNFPTSDEGRADCSVGRKTHVRAPSGRRVIGRLGGDRNLTCDLRS